MASMRYVVLGAFFLWVQLIAASPAPMPGGLGSNGDSPNKNASRALAKRIALDDESKLVPNSFIAVYKKTASDKAVNAMTASISAQLKKRNLNKRGVGGELLSTEVRSIKMNAWRAMTFEAEESMVNEVAESDDVEYVEQDQWMSTFGVVAQLNAPTGLQRLSEAAPVGEQTKTGAFVFDESAGYKSHIYILDSGCFVEHDDFGGRASHLANHVNGETETDGNGHGTHVACTAGGTNFGVAKKATIHCVKVMNAKGRGRNTDIIAGIQSVIDHVVANSLQNRAVMNLSLGGGLSKALNTAMDNAFKAAILCVVAAGNENQDARNVSPASASTAFTVAAIDGQTDQKARFSNFGPAVDISASGVKIVSCGIGSKNAVATKNGSSSSCPICSGQAAADCTTAPEGTGPAQIIDGLLRKARDTQAVVRNSAPDTPLEIINSGNQKDRNLFLTEDGMRQGTPDTAASLN